MWAVLFSESWFAMFIFSPFVMEVENGDLVNSIPTFILGISHYLLLTVPRRCCSCCWQLCFSLRRLCFVLVWFVFACRLGFFFSHSVVTVQIICIGADRSPQTVQTKIRLLLKKQSDQGLRCLPFHQHLLGALMQCYIKVFYF